MLNVFYLVDGCYYLMFTARHREVGWVSSLILQTFRRNQLEAINATLDGNDIFVLMSTRHAGCLRSPQKRDITASNVKSNIDRIYICPQSMIRSPSQLYKFYSPK